MGLVPGAVDMPLVDQQGLLGSALGPGKCRSQEAGRVGDIADVLQRVLKLPRFSFSLVESAHADQSLHEQRQPPCLPPGMGSSHTGLDVPHETERLGHARVVCLGLCEYRRCDRGIAQILRSAYFVCRFLGFRHVPVCGRPVSTSCGYQRCGELHERAMLWLFVIGWTDRA